MTIITAICGVLIGIAGAIACTREADKVEQTWGWIDADCEK